MVLGSHRPTDHNKILLLKKKLNGISVKLKTVPFRWKSESLCVNANFITDHPVFKLSMEKQNYQGESNHIILIFKIEHVISCYKWNLKNNPDWYINIVNTARYVSSSLDSACEGIRSNIKLCLTTNAFLGGNCSHLFKELLSKIVGCHVLQTRLPSHFTSHITIEVGTL